jgi:hypothetical protein
MTYRGTFVAASLIALISSGSAFAEPPMHPMGPGNCPMMGAGMMGGKMMMGGMGPMMGGGMMGCPMMERNVVTKLEKRDDGVTITLTSKDPAVVRRLQKRAEILRLMHELQAEDGEAPAE